MSDLSEKIVGKIKERKIVPIPKWQFLLKGWFIWGIALMGILFGSISIGIVLHQLFASDAAPFRHASDIVVFFPYFWVVILIGFMYISYHNFVHTESGYKYRTATILGVSIGIAVILGSIFAITGIGGRINMFFSSNIPFYSKYADMRVYVWMNPEEGRLAGKIITIDNTSKTFSLRDLNGRDWQIKYEYAVIRRAVSFREGEIIKVLGKKESSNTFRADDIRPWSGQRQFMQENKQGVRSIR